MFRSTALILLILMSAGAMTAQPAYRPVATSSLPLTGSIVGKVDCPGLASAVNVRIRLRGTAGIIGSQPAFQDGTFVFFDIAPGNYTLDIDPSGLPERFRPAGTTVTAVKAGERAEVSIVLEPRRSIIGRAYIDVNEDGAYTPSKDVLVSGAQITADGGFAVSGEGGSYRLEDLPAGRTSLLILWPGGTRTTHVVLDLGVGPVTNRVVNIGLLP